MSRAAGEPNEVRREERWSILAARLLIDVAGPERAKHLVMLEKDLADGEGRTGVEALLDAMGRLEREGPALLETLNGE